MHNIAGCHVLFQMGGMPGYHIIGGWITLSIHLCKCMWKFTKTFILHPFYEGFRQFHDFTNKARQLFKIYTAYATVGLLDLVFLMCSVYLIFNVLLAGPA